jgi:hypothetical protein
MAIGKNNFGPAIFKAGLKPGKKFPGDFNHSLINVHHNDLLYRMPEDFPQSSSIASSNYQHLFRFGMAVEGRLDEHFVIEKLVSLCCLNQAIKQQHPAIGFIFDDLN